MESLTPSGTMIAMQYVKYGGPEKLRMQLADIPSPHCRQVLIRVHATSVNPIDWKLRTGEFKWLFPQRFPVAPGFDVAGEIVALGRSVKELCVGQRVFARLDNMRGGAAAEFCVCGRDVVAPIPETMSYEEAAGLPLAGMTALQGLRDQGRLQKNHRLLVVGASGGVGHYAVQIGKLLGADVTTVSSQRNHAFVTRLGADRCIDYQKTSDFSGEEPYDVILDCVGELGWSDVQPWMSKKGAFVSCLPRPSFFFRGFWCWLTSSQRCCPVILDPKREDLTQLGQWVREGRLQTHVHQTLPLSELSTAHELSQSGRTVGKLIITLDEDEE